MKNIEERVVAAAERALAHHGYVSAIDVLTRMNLLAPVNVEAWRAGRIAVLESQIQGHPKNLAEVFRAFVACARERKLQPMEIPCRRTTPAGVVDLRFTLEGDAATEQFFRTHYVSPEFSEKEQEKLSKPKEKVAIQPLRAAQCGECGAEIEDFLIMEEDQPLCLECGGLGGLEFLPSGDTALTRRTTKYSARTIVVVRFSRARKRYERQGILADPAAIERAEQECVADADRRAAVRKRAAADRSRQDAVFTERMKEAVLAMFSACPPNEAAEIASHTAKRGSGRVGRSEAGRKFDERAVELAVRASVRHRHTKYDELLAAGSEREFARARVSDNVEEILKSWRE